MVIDHSANVDTITKVVQTHVSEAKLDRSNGKELAYTLPVPAVSNFAGRYGPRWCLPKQDQIHSSCMGESYVSFSRKRVGFRAQGSR